MKRLFLLLLLLVNIASAETIFIRDYNSSAVVNFCLYAADGSALESAATCATGDIVISKDEGVEANATNCFVDEGSCYSLTLTATELQAARLMIIISDQTGPQVWLDRSIIIETRNSSSSQHPNILDSVTYAEQSGPPSYPMSLSEMIRSKHSMEAHKHTVTSSEKRYYKDNESDTYGTQSLTDNGTTLTVGELQ